MRLLLIIPFVLFLYNAKAQYQSLTSDYKKPHLTWMAAPILELERNASSYAFFGGGELGLLIDKKYWIGAYYSTALTGFYPPGYDDREEFKNYFDQGGLIAGYIPKSNDLIHPYFHIRAGIGNFAIGENLGEEFLNLGLYILQPSIGLEINLNPSIKAGLGIFYRIVNPVELSIYKDASMQAVGISFSFRFGKFEPQ